MTPIIATEEARKGFYPTPPALAKKLLEGIELDWTNSILEPSAGTGSLIMAFADQVYEKYYHGSFGRCDLNVDCCEIDAGLRGILTDNFSGKAREKTEQDVKDFEKVCYDRDASPYDEPEYDVLCKSEVLLRNIKLRVVNDDFLSYDTFKPYDLIVMNPPFANGDKHLLKAISMQERTGGKIRCILNAEMIRNPYTRSRQELVRKLSELNAEISFETDAFGNAERKTDVEVAIIKLDIPEPHRESDIFKNCLKAETQKMAQAQESTELVFSDKIKQTVAYYRAEIAAGVKLIEEYTALKPYIMSSVKKSEYAQPLITLAVGSDSASDKLNIESYCQAVRSKYWRALFMNPEFTQQLTSEIQSDLRSRVDEMKDLEFSEYNIRTLYSLYAQMETAKAELGKPFPQEEELRAKAARLAELNIELNIDDKTPLEQMAEEAPRAEIAKSAKPSVLQKLHSYSAQSQTEPKKSVEEVR